MVVQQNGKFEISSNILHFKVFWIGYYWDSAVNDKNFQNKNSLNKIVFYSLVTVWAGNSRLQDGGRDEEAAARDISARMSLART